MDRHATLVAWMRARRLLIPVLSCAALLAPSVAPADTIAYGPCQSRAGFQCGVLSVPLDRSGTVGGTVTLAVTRAVASSNPERKALLALAGGPGQAATPLAEDFAAAMGAGLADRDLLVFDQRGTGASGALQCTALLSGHSSGSIVTDARRCATQLGPARGLYTTAQSVEDIEAIRAASGYEKLTIYGVSYGTKVALAYAASHPEHVDGLILDSVVRADGPDPFHRSTFAATRRVLDELCSEGDCRGITNDPTGELAREVARLARHRLRGSVVNGHGRRLRLSMSDLDVLQIALSGDVNPTLRAELPSSVHSALHGDRTPLLRLAARSEGLNEINAMQSAAGGDSDALFAATRCEETAFPWDRNADAITRAQQATAAAKALSAASLRPFNRDIALRGELIPLCVGWPVASPAPAGAGPLPQVPTLVLEGQADLRTPLEDGQAVAAQIPGATVVAIPHTGHSVLGSDLSTCGMDAVSAFFGGSAPAACAPTKNLFFPTPVAPTKLRRVPGRTRAIKTVNAVAETLDDVRRHFIGDAVAAGHSPRAGSRVGGLRSGYARYTNSGIVLRRTAYVPRVEVSGLYHLGDNSSSTVTVGGRGAPHGRITFHGDGRVTGRLGGHRVSVKASAARVERPQRWPLRLPPFPALRRG
jgi:pimeloyl-ACP methyl ester carboxylesterase